MERLPRTATILVLTMGAVFSLAPVIRSIPTQSSAHSKTTAARPLPMNYSLAVRLLTRAIRTSHRLLSMTSAASVLIESLTVASTSAHSKCNQSSQLQQLHQHRRQRL